VTEELVYIERVWWNGTSQGDCERAACRNQTETRPLTLHALISVLLTSSTLVMRLCL